MATTLQEFEVICVELQSNPGKATKGIESFRDQDYALEACHTWIRTPGCSAIAQFQLALVIQYSSLRNWSYLPAETIASLRETLWGLIETAVASGSMPTFALNKVILVFVLLWKRGWKDGSTTDQESLFQRISGFLGTAQSQGGGSASASGSIANPDAFKHGPLILRVLLEEFNNVNTTEIALPLEFHEKSHKKYEQYGLGESLRLCMGCLTVSYQQIAESEGATLTSSTINVVAESVKLFTELLHWNFDSLSNSNKGQSKANLLSLPRTWAEAIIGANVIEGTYSVYDKLRALCVHLASQPAVATPGGGGAGLIRKVDPAEVARQQTLKDTVSCMSEIRVLMITLSSISGSPFFQSDDERVGYGDSLMARTKSLLEASVSSGNQEIQAHSSFAVLMEELRSRECESFSSTFLRLLGNFRLVLCFRMPAFTPMLLQLGQSTHQLAAEIKARVTVSVEKIRSGLDWNDEESMFLGWRGEALALLFDSWCIILDDPTMQRAAHDNNNNNGDSISGGNGALTTPQLQQLKADMAQMAQQVYRELFECYFLSVVHEALMGADEDEDEDEENIESRNKEEILACIGTIGRSALVPSLECIVTAMHSACQEAEALAAALASGAGMTPQIEADKLRVLEMMRIVTLFGCHLFAEDFTTDSTATGSSSAEANILPQGVLDEGVATPVAGNSVLQLYWCFHNCLQQQMQLAEASNGMHPLVSPYLLQHLFRVLGEYCLRFLDPDASLYYEQGGNPLLRLHGPDFNSSVEVLLTSCRQVIVSMPLENELVLSVASLITAMSKSSEPQRLAFILNCGAITDIFRLLSGGAEEGCRLNENGLSAVFKALSCVAIKAKNEQVFMQLCTHVHGIASQLAMVQQRGGKLTSEDQKVVSNLVACLQGMCGTPSGLDKIIRELFDFVLPVVAWCAQQFASLRADDVSTSILLLMRDYADHKLMGLPQASSLVLYRASLDTMNVMLASLDFHAQSASSPGQGGGAREEEREEFRSDTILRLLQLLNILASKDFFLDCEEDVVAAIAASGTMNPNTGQTTAQSEVCRVLIIGFQSIVPLLSADLLRTHPACCDRYFSFTTFVVNTYMEKLDEMLSGDNGVDNDDKTSFFVTLMQHLLWGAGAIDSSAARQALKSIQAIADYYFTGLRAGAVSDKGGPGNNIGPAAAGAIFPLATTRLLEMIFYPNTCEYGIAQDRMDACGNALITLIAIDSNRFHQCAHAIVSQFSKHHPSAEQPLLSCFKKLMEDRGVNMGAIDKRNRQTFCMNFRDFILAVRPVVKG